MNNDNVRGCGFLCVILVGVFIVSIIIYNDNHTSRSTTSTSVYQATMPTYTTSSSSNVLDIFSTERKDIYDILHAEPRGKVVTRKATPDAYSEGYDEGYEQGEYDGRHGYTHGYGYDDSNRYHDYFETKYQEGYSDGYDDGYSESYSDIKGSEQEDEDDW